MKILITGSLGCVGSRLVPFLKQSGELHLTDIKAGKVDGIDVIPCDLTQFDQVEKITTGIDAIVHCAIFPYAKTNHRVAEERHAYFQGAIQVNCLGTYHLFESAARAGVKKFINISSLTTMLRKPIYPMITEELPDKTQTVYSCTKLFSEKLGEVFASEGKLNVFNLRLGDPTTIEELAITREALKNFSHKIGSIVLINDIALAINGSLNSSLEGHRLYHIVTPSTDPWISWQKAKAEIGYDSPYFLTETTLEKQ